MDRTRPAATSSFKRDGARFSSSAARWTLLRIRRTTSVWVRDPADGPRRTAGGGSWPSRGGAGTARNRLPLRQRPARPWSTVKTRRRIRFGRIVHAQAHFRINGSGMHIRVAEGEQPVLRSQGTRPPLCPFRLAKLLTPARDAHRQFLQAVGARLRSSRLQAQRNRSALIQHPVRAELPRSFSQRVRLFQHPVTQTFEQRQMSTTLPRKSAKALRSVLSPDHCERHRTSPRATRSIRVTPSMSPSALNGRLPHARDRLRSRAVSREPLKCACRAEHGLAGLAACEPLPHAARDARGAAVTVVSAAFPAFLLVNSAFGI